MQSTYEMLESGYMLDETTSSLAAKDRTAPVTRARAGPPRPNRDDARQQARPYRTQLAPSNHYRAAHHVESFPVLFRACPEVISHPLRIVRFQPPKTKTTI
jgi:hypothetical protein